MGRLLHVAALRQRFAFPLQQSYLFTGVAINDSNLKACVMFQSSRRICDVKETCFHLFVFLSSRRRQIKNRCN